MTSLNISYCLLVPGHSITTVTGAELSFNFAVSGHETEICAGVQEIFTTCVRAFSVHTLSIVILCRENPLQHSDLELNIK